MCSLDHANPHKTMLKDALAAIHRRPGPAWAFLAVTAIVAAMVFGVRFFGTLAAPPTYASTIRIKLTPRADSPEETKLGTQAAGDHDPSLLPTEYEVIRSERILAEVASVLGSDQRHVKSQPATLHDLHIQNQIAHLRTQIEARSNSNTNVLEVTALGKDGEEAARIANAVGQAYCEYQNNLLQRLASPVSKSFNAEVMNRALTITRPQRLRTIAGVARETLGAILLGAAAGLLVVRTAYRRNPPVTTEVLPWLFVLVFFVVLGVGMIESTVSLSVATAVGLLLAFVVGSIADWFCFLRRRYPEPRNVIAAVFVAVLFLMIGLGAINAAWSGEWYSSTARVRLRRVTPHREGPGIASGASPVYDPKLIGTECDAICSESNLCSVIRVLDLDKQLGARYYGGTPFATSWSLAYLKKRCRVRRLPGTCLIEICVLTEKPDDAAEFANTLVDSYRGRQNDPHQGPQDQPTALEVEVLDHATPPTSPTHQYILGQIMSWSLTGLCVAFVAAGAAGWAASQIAKARAKTLVAP